MSAVAGALLLLAAAGDGPPTYLAVAELDGAASGQRFSEPTRVAVDPVSHELAVLDLRAGTRIVILDASGAFIFAIDASHGLRTPEDLAIAPDGRIFVAERDRVSIFSFRGQRRGELALPAVEGKAAAYVRVAHGADGRWLVADRSGPRLLVLSAAGEVALDLRGDPKTAKPFATVSDAATDPAGNIYLLDGQEARVAVFSPQGELQRTFGQRGMGRLSLAVPVSLALLGESVVLVDSVRGAFLLFDIASGRCYAQFGRPGRGLGALSFPADGAVDGERVVVADTQNHRVQLFAPWRE